MATEIEPTALLGNKRIDQLPAQIQPPDSWLLFTGDPASGQLYKSTMQQLGFVKLSSVGQPGGVPSLDSTGKVPASQIPSIAITNTYVVNSEAEMLALPANVGDVAIRTDLSKSYILQTEPASTLSHWVFLQSPTGPTVSSVNGMTGDVVLTGKNGIRYDGADKSFKLGQPFPAGAGAGVIDTDTSLSIDYGKKFWIQATTGKTFLKFENETAGQEISAELGIAIPDGIGGTNLATIKAVRSATATHGLYMLVTQGATTKYSFQSDILAGTKTTYNLDARTDVGASVFQRLYVAGSLRQQTGIGMFSFGKDVGLYGAVINVRSSTDAPAFFHLSGNDDTLVARWDPSMLLIQKGVVELGSGVPLHGAGDVNYFTQRLLVGHSVPSAQPGVKLEVGPEAHWSNSIMTVANMNDTKAKGIAANFMSERRMTLNDGEIYSAQGSIVAAGYLLTDATASVANDYQMGVLAGYFSGGFLNKGGVATTAIQLGLTPQFSTTVTAIKALSQGNTQNLTGWFSALRTIFSRYQSAGSVENYADIIAGCSDGPAANITNRYGLYIVDMGLSATNRYGIFQQGAGARNIFNGTLEIPNVINAGTNTGKFAVYDTNGVLRFRTTAEMQGDIGVNDVSPSFSVLAPAIAVNSIDNTSFGQRWSWNALGGGTGLTIDSNALGVVGQNLVKIELTGDNGGETTTALLVKNIRTGAGQNYGAFFQATGSTVQNFAAGFFGEVTINSDSLSILRFGNETFSTTWGNIGIEVLDGTGAFHVRSLNYNMALVANNGTADIYMSAHSLVLRENSTSPPTPSATWGKLYAKDDGHLWYKNSGGTDFDLTLGGGGGTDTNLFNTDLTLTANRTHELNGKVLTFKSSVLDGAFVIERVFGITRPVFKINGSSTGYNDPLMRITSNGVVGNGEYQSLVEMLAPNAGDNTFVQTFIFGKAKSTNNSGVLIYGHAADGSADNSMSLHLYSNSVVNFSGTRVYFFKPLDLLESASTTNPAAGSGRIYAKNDGHLWYKNSAGTDFDLTLGGGAGADTNFATTDLTFTAARTHDLNGQLLTLTTGVANGALVLNRAAGVQAILRVTGASVSYSDPLVTIKSSSATGSGSFQTMIEGLAANLADGQGIQGLVFGKNTGVNNSGVLIYQHVANGSADNSVTIATTANFIATFSGTNIKFMKPLDMTEVASTTNPAAGLGRIYAKTDGHLYYKNSAGTDFDLTLGGGSANAVTNAGTSTDSAIARWDGATGKIIQDSTALLDDTALLTVRAIVADAQNTTNAPSLYIGNAGAGTSGIIYHLAAGGNFSIHNDSALAGFNGFNISSTNRRVAFLVNGNAYDPGFSGDAAYTFINVGQYAANASVMIRGQVDQTGDLLQLQKSDGVVALSVGINGTIGMGEIASVTTPAANFGRIYAKTDGKIWYKNSAGTDFDLTLGGGGGADTNFSTTDLTFAAARTHDLNGQLLTLTTGVANGALVLNRATGAQTILRVTGSSTGVNDPLISIKTNGTTSTGGQTAIEILAANLADGQTVNAISFGKSLSYNYFATLSFTYVGMFNPSNAFNITIANTNVATFTNESVKLLLPVDLPYRATAATPAANTGRVYTKTDGNLWYKNAAGTDTIVTGGSGAIVPTSTDTNVGSKTWQILHYTRSGNEVSFTAWVMVAATAAGAVTLRVAAPIVSAFTSNVDAVGLGTNMDAAGATAISVQAVTGTGNLEFRFTAADTGSHPIIFSGHYTVK